ncbi:MAG TPA: YXWGXW repeat-containing protein [Polyangiaceae bacterium]|nr:YXWGXW repeat-containing protein [Polyangiaceae bacterium]
MEPRTAVVTERQLWADNETFQWIRSEHRVTVSTVIRIAPYAVGLIALSGCVIGRPALPSINESAQGPLTAPVTGSPVVPHSAPADGDEAPEKPKPDATWVRGYWHWDGVRYVWQRGRWQDDAGAARTTPIH